MSAYHFSTSCKKKKMAPFFIWSYHHAIKFLEDICHFLWFVNKGKKWQELHVAKWTKRGEGGKLAKNSSFFEEIFFTLLVHFGIRKKISKHVDFKLRSPTAVRQVFQNYSTSKFRILSHIMELWNVAKMCFAFCVCIHTKGGK